MCYGRLSEHPLCVWTWRWRLSFYFFSLLFVKSFGTMEAHRSKSCQWMAMSAFTEISAAAGDGPSACQGGPLLGQAREVVGQDCGKGLGYSSWVGSSKCAFPAQGSPPAQCITKRGSVGTQEKTVVLTALPLLTEFEGSRYQFWLLNPFWLIWAMLVFAGLVILVWWEHW